MGRGPGRSHDATRDVIADAACALIGREGTAALSIRRIATESGASSGRVQHYFPGRAELVEAAFVRVQQRTRLRVESALGGSASESDVVAVILRAMIPRTPPEMEEARVIAAFEALALTEPKLAEALKTGHAALVDLLSALIADGGAADGGPADDGTADGGPAEGGAADSSTVTMDAESTAVTLLAMAEGLFGQVLHSHLSADTADRILDAALERVVR